MKSQRDNWSRREFLRGVSLAGSSVILGLRPDVSAGEPPPETTKISLVRSPGIICIAPLYVAEEFLRGEGFSEVQYITKKGRIDANKAVASGEAQITITFNGLLSIQVDEGDPIVTLAGVHAGCYELFTSNRIRSIRDLKGKSVAVTDLGSGRHVFLASMLTYVGLSPRKDVNFVTYEPAEAMRLFAQGTVSQLVKISS